MKNVYDPNKEAKLSKLYDCGVEYKDVNVGNIGQQEKISGIDKEYLLYCHLSVRNIICNKEWIMSFEEDMIS